MTASDALTLTRMFNRIAKAIDLEKDYLTTLDGAIGDADHGITMSLGFGAVATALSRTDQDGQTAAGVMSTAATAFLDAAGASTGPLYATAFRRVAKELERHGQLDGAGQIEMLRAISVGIQQRGKGQRGDKTMLDAWIPALEAAQSCHDRAGSSAQMWQAAYQASERGALETQSMVAMRGRAARLGERSLGHVDPGAASAVIIIREMMETFSA